MINAVLLSISISSMFKFLTVNIWLVNAISFKYTAKCNGVYCLMESFLLILFFFD